MLDFPPLSQMISVSKVLSGRLWAEANAGNMSIRLDPSELPPLLGNAREFKLAETYTDLEGEWFLVTATKSRARDMEHIPASTIGLFEITGNGKKARCHWGTGPPTSEFPAHMSIYSHCIKNKPEINAVLHTHPPNLIAMSHLPEMQWPGKINKMLRSIHPEVSILVPDGIAHIDYDIPGSYELGVSTGEALTSSRCALWPMHGIVSIAEDLEKALDQVEILEKAATIFMLVHGTGQEPVGLTREQVKRSCKFWGIESDSD